MDKNTIIRDKQGRFMPGISPNPDGRPQEGESIAGVLREYLSEKKTVRSKKARKLLLIEKLYAKAEAGDIQAIKLIMAYTDGMPVARVQEEIIQPIQLSPQWVAIRGLIVNIINKHPELREEFDELDLDEEPTDGD